VYLGKYFPMDNFSGGWCKNLPSTQLNPSQAHELDNIVVKPGGKGFRSRLGNAKFNAVAMNSGVPVQGVGYYLQEDQDKWLVTVCGNKVFKSANLSGTMDDITGSLTITAGADNQWDMFTFNDTLLAFGGPLATPNAAFKWTGTGDAAVLTGNPSSNLKGALSANNRVFGWDGSTMYWTVIGDFEDWSGAGSGQATIGSLNDSQIITGAVVISTNYMLVFKENSVNQMVIASAPFPVYSLFDTVGAVGKRAIVNVDGNVFFIAKNKKMYSTDGENIQEYPDVADDLWSSVQASRMPYINGFRQQGTDYDWLVWTVSTAGSTNNIAIIWDLQNKCWLRCTTGYKMNVATMAPTGDIYMGGYDGHIYTPAKAATYADASETAPGTITAYWQTGWLNPTIIDQITHPKKVVIVASPRATGNITLSYGFDGLVNTSSVTLAQQAGTTETYVQKVTNLSGRGNTLELKVQGSSATIDVSIDKIILAGKMSGQKGQAQD